MTHATRAIVATALAGAFLLVAPAASAAEPAAISFVGWWSQNPAAQEQPPGGSQVSHSLGGPLSMAAVRFQVDVPLRSAILQLPETANSIAADMAGVHACPTSSDWEPSNPGAWDARPEADCEARSVTLVRQGNLWTGDIASLLNEGESSVAIVPVGLPSTLETFQIEFGSAHLVATAAAQPPRSDPDTQTSPRGSSPDDDTPPASTEGSTSPANDDDVPVAAPASAPTDAAVPGDTTEGFPAEPPVEDFPPVDDTTVLAQEELETTDSGPGRPWWKLLILVPVSAVIGYGAVYARRVARDRGLSSGS